MASTSQRSSCTGRPFVRGRTRVSRTDPNPGVARLTFGKHKGLTLAEVRERGDTQYLRWLTKEARQPGASPELVAFARIAARYLKE